ncbi:MAG: polyprenol phosphomannose-dependent alpha 1,6 mannosyltransferase MptB [Acidimicrobiia bacterium]
MSTALAPETPESPESEPNRPHESIPRRAAIALSGLLATTLIEIGGWRAGVQPRPRNSQPWLTGVPVLRDIPSVPLPLARVSYAGGLIALCLTWLWMRRTAKHEQWRARTVLAIVALWVVPLLPGPPLASRDAYSYAAQGQMAVRHLEPYTYGPARLWDDPYLNGVDPIWRTTASPYGPTATAVSATAARIAGPHPLAAVLILRFVMVAALAVCGWAVVRLAQATRRSATDATVLALANPLVILHLVGGLHNEALMLAFMLSGLALARSRPGWKPWFVGIALVTLAASVKIPAAIAAVWLGWYGPMAGDGHDADREHARQPSPLAPRWKTIGLAGLTGLVVLQITGMATGHGWAWMHNLNTASSVYALLSVTSTIGLAGRRLLRNLGYRGLGRTFVSLVRDAGQVLAVGIIAWLLVRRRNGDLVTNLGWGLTALALLSPAVYPWYATWGLMLFAVAWSGTRARLLIVASIALCFMVTPSGPAILPNLARLRLTDGRLIISLIVIAACALWARHEVRNSRQEAVRA